MPSVKTFLIFQLCFTESDFYPQSYLDLVHLASGNTDRGGVGLKVICNPTFVLCGFIRHKSTNQVTKRNFKVISYVIVKKLLPKSNLFSVSTPPP